MSDLNEFASGLSGPDMDKPAIDPRGAKLLLSIRTFAKTISDDLAPLCVNRFDGVERIEPQASDIEEKATCDAIVALVDLIKMEPDLCRKIAAQLAHGGGRAR